MISKIGHVALQEFPDLTVGIERKATKEKFLGPFCDRGFRHRAFTSGTISNKHSISLLSILCLSWLKLNLLKIRSNRMLILFTPPPPATLQRGSDSRHCSVLLRTIPFPSRWLVFCCCCFFLIQHVIMGIFFFKQICVITLSTSCSNTRSPCRPRRPRIVHLWDSGLLQCWIWPTSYCLLMLLRKQLNWKIKKCTHGQRVF